MTRWEDHPNFQWSGILINMAKERAFIDIEENDEIKLTLRLNSFCKFI